jgi:DNA-binding beta-propeller fold protein YncE
MARQESRVAGLLALVTLCIIQPACFADRDRPNKQTSVPVRTIVLEESPSHFILYQDKLFVGSFHGTGVSVVDIYRRKVLQRFQLDAYEVSQPVIVKGEEVLGKRDIHHYPPGEMVIANGKLFLGQIFSDFLLVYDLPTMEVVKRIPLGGEGCLAASADGKKVYFASNCAREFSIIDTDTYETRTIPYPGGGHGIGALALSPDQKHLYLGIQRGGVAPDDKKRQGGNSFLAIYDLERQRYADTVYLAEIAGESSDDSIPQGFAFSPDQRQLYVGMSQSLAGIRIVDTATRKLMSNIAFKPGPRHTFPHQYVDPVDVAIYGPWLLSANHLNRELAIIDRGTHQILASLTFADSKSTINGLLIHGDHIYLGNPGAGRIHVMNGRTLTRRIRKALKQAHTEQPVRLTIMPR